MIAREDLSALYQEIADFVRDSAKACQNNQHDNNDNNANHDIISIIIVVTMVTIINIIIQHSINGGINKYDKPES